jgi:hypothetical protein
VYIISGWNSGRALAIGAICACTCNKKKLEKKARQERRREREGLIYYITSIAVYKTNKCFYSDQIDTY